MWLYIAVMVCICSEVASASKNCCPSPNILGSGKCANGENTAINCTKFILSPPDNETTFDITNDGALILENEVVPFDRYCLSATSDGTAAALVCIQETKAPSYVSTAICTFLSVFFLALTIIVYCLVLELRDLQGICTLHSIIGLALAFLALGSLQFELPGFCIELAFISYSSFLYCFFWLNTLAFHIWRTVIQPKISATERQWQYLYYCYGIGGPLIFVTALLITQFAEGGHVKPRIGENKCWFNDMHSTFVYFYGPISVLLCINVILFLSTSIHLWKSIPRQSSSKVKALRYKFSLYIKLFFIMGLSWIFEILSAIFNDHGKFLTYMWVITDYINALQGILIFTLLILTRKRALKGIAKRGLCCIRFPKEWTMIPDEETEEGDPEEVGLSKP